MKLSANPKSPHYVRDLIGHNRILLHGVDMRDVTFANDEAGYIIRTKRDDKGNLVTKGNLIVHERVYGAVQIIDLRQQ
ncbi:hypothetical protein D3227_25705 [Mesorhizobium waimense]|uniref:Uncharacterized protein n=1 Tax=Mesorhizobium waimense TaxID=1300307 RepID=A0A3A5KCW2_9HYPH|nr:hypothetical protein D3227_25705 [Mesorhizobium waimense]